MDNKNEVICEYCKNKLKNIMMLNKHQRVTKYCLVIQGKIEDEKKKKREARDKIEREKAEEKERRRETKFTCEYCKVKLSSKNSLFGHIDICLEKYKKIILDKEKEINDVNRKLCCIIEEQKKERENWESIKNKWKIKKDKYRKLCSNIKTENNTTRLKETDLSEEKLFDVFSYYGKEYFYKGSTGVAKFIKENIMTGINGESTVICTDVSRKTFYNNINGKQVRDPGLLIFYSKLDPWIKKGNDRVYGEEYIEICEKGGDDLSVREKKNKLIITYRDTSNSSKIIKRLAEFSYVSPPVDGDLSL